MAERLFDLLIVLGAESTRPIYIGLVFFLIVLGLLALGVSLKYGEQKWFWAGIGFFVPIIPIAFLLQNTVR